MLLVFSLRSSHHELIFIVCAGEETALRPCSDYRWRPLLRFVETTCSFLFTAATAVARQPCWRARGKACRSESPLVEPPSSLLRLLMCFGSTFVRTPCRRSQRWEQPHCWNVLLALGEHAGCHALSSLPGLSSQFAVTQKQRHLIGNVRMDAGRAVL